MASGPFCYLLSASDLKVFRGKAAEAAKRAKSDLAVGSSAALSAGSSSSKGKTVAQVCKEQKRKAVAQASALPETGKVPRVTPEAEVDSMFS